MAKKQPTSWKVDIARAWRDLLSDPKVGKIAHNIKFEESWSYHKFGAEDIVWAWDSMLAAHVIDNRVGLCGLKLQVFLNFGLETYDDLISPFLQSVDRDPNSPNRIREFVERHGADEALYYCGLDSLLGFRLAMKQMSEIGST